MYASLMTVGGVGKRQRRAVYLCRYHKDRGAAFCAQPPVPTHVVDETVFVVVQRQLRSWLLTSPDENPQVMAPAAAVLAAVSFPLPSVALSQAEAQRDRLLASANQLGDRAPSVLRERLATAEADATRLTTMAQRHSAGRAEPAGPLWDFPRRPQATLAALDNAGRRIVLAPLLASVVVRGKAVVAVRIRKDDGIVESAPLAPAKDAS